MENAEDFLTTLSSSSNGASMLFAVTLTLAGPSGLTADNDSTTTAPNITCPNISDFQLYLNTVVIPLLCLLGLTGNTISILVLQKDRHNRVAVFLLQSLAIADNSVLCLVFVALSIAYGLLPVVDRTAHFTFHPYVVKYINPVGNIALSTVIWLTVLLGINRYIAICRPFSAKRWLTMKYARIQVAVVVTVSVLLNVPRLFVHVAIPSTVNMNGCFPVLEKSKFGNDTVLDTIYFNGFYSSVVLILPLVLLVGFNVPLIRQMQRSKRRMKRNSLSYSGRQESSITLVMVVIIAVLVICHAPDRIAQLVRVGSPMERINYPYPLFYVMNITNMFVILNCSTDFIVYYIFRRRFRRILCNKLCCFRRDSTNQSPVQSDAGNGNAVCSYGNGNSRARHYSPEGVGVGGGGQTPPIKPFSLKERYKLTKKRDSNQILLLKLHNVT